MKTYITQLTAYIHIYLTKNLQLKVGAKVWHYVFSPNVSKSKGA
jgi:hypothetical protein